MLLISLFCLRLRFCSTDSSSSSSDDSPARSVQSAAVPAPTSQLLSALEKDEPRKSFGIKVQNLPVRSTGNNLYRRSLLSATTGGNVRRSTLSSVLGQASLLWLINI